jgi:lipopolysaccharide transport system ATP-binding protein
MAAVNRLCPHAMWISDGQVETFGMTRDVVAAYLSAAAAVEGQHGERRWDQTEQAPGNDAIRLRAVRIHDANGKVTSTLDVRLAFSIELEYEILKPLIGIQVGFWILTVEGVVVFVGGDNEDAQWLGKMRDCGRYKSVCKVPGRLLNSGPYTITVASDARNAQLLFVEEQALRFQVEPTELPAHSSTRPAGVIAPFLEWRVSKIA